MHRVMITMIFLCNLKAFINFYKTKTLQRVNKIALKNNTKHQLSQQISMYAI